VLSNSGQLITALSISVIQAVVCSNFAAGLTLVGWCGVRGGRPRRLICPEYVAPEGTRALALVRVRACATHSCVSQYVSCIYVSIEMASVRCIRCRDGLACLISAAQNDWWLTGRTAFAPGACD
jgi:hypothetical protein